MDLPNPIGTWPLLATAAKWTHIASAYVLVAALAGHVGLVLWHTLVLRDGLLRRMLPSVSRRGRNKPRLIGRIAPICPAKRRRNTLRDCALQR